MSQLSNTNFLSKWLSLFADNTTGDISEGDMRDFRQDISDSFVNVSSDTNFENAHESLTDGSSISWDMGNKYFGDAKLYTAQTSGFTLTLSNFALGTRRKLFIIKASANDLTVTLAGYTFKGSNTRYPITSIILRGAATSTHLLELERVDNGPSTDPYLNVFIDYKNNDRDFQNINIVKTSHGLSVGDIVTKTGSDYSQLSALTEVPIGIVDFLPEGSYAADNFRMVTSGFVYGLTGLTANTMYYVQSTGVLGTTVTKIPFLWAISTTSGYITRVAQTESGNNNTDIRYYEQDDFIGSDLFDQSVSGSGATTGYSTTGHNSTENALGVVELACGTTTTGRSSVIRKLVGSGLLLGLGHTITIKFRLTLEALSNGTDTYTVYVGLIDNIGSGDQADGCYFRYNHSVNSGKWEAVNASNSTRTAVDTGISPTATENQIFTITASGDGSSVSFDIDGTTVTNTTNIPTSSGRETKIGFKIEKSAGSTSRSVYVDWYDLTITRSTAR